MKENNNTNESLEQVTGIKSGSNEFGSMRDIHQQYNTLSGFESMLHIIKKYRYVLYPFIFLSILGSTYSFYNDFIVGFPMNSDYINLAMALFLSIALEIVRDASILAIFNTKMKLPSRLLVSMIFLVVTSYLFSSHMNAIKIIEKNSIEYTLGNQDDKQIIANSPEMREATEAVAELKEDLKLKRAEKTPQLIENSTSIHIKKRESALSRIAEIDAKIAQIKEEIKGYNATIKGERKDNIKSIEDKQKIISAVLLATLILIESLAMLGAVIKFIVTNNADKEIAKHSEIIEEYISISEVMKTTNISLTQNMAMIAQQNADNNLRTIEMMASMNNQINSKIYSFMDMMGKQNFSNTVTKQEPKKQVSHQQKNDKEFIINLFKNVEKIGDKLSSKSSLIDVDNRAEDRYYKEMMSKLSKIGVVEYKKGHGYYAQTTLEGAISAIS